MTVEHLLIILLVLALALAPEVPEWVARLLSVDAKRSPQHERRAIRRVAVWFALCMAAVVYVTVRWLDLHWTPWTVTSGVLLLLLATGAFGGCLWIALAARK